MADPMVTDPSDSQKQLFQMDPMVTGLHLPCSSPASSPEVPVASTEIAILSPPESMEDTHDNFQTPPDDALPHPPSSPTLLAARSAEAVMSESKEIGVFEAESKNRSELGFPSPLRDSEREETMGSADLGSEVVEVKEMAVEPSVVETGEEDAAEGSTAVVGEKAEKVDTSARGEIQEGEEHAEKGSVEWLRNIQEVLMMLSRNDTENDDGVDLETRAAARSTEAVMSESKEIEVFEAESKNGSGLGFPSPPLMDSEREETMGSADLGSEIVDAKEMAVEPSVVETGEADAAEGSTAVVGEKAKKVDTSARGEIQEGEEHAEKGSVEWLRNIQEVLMMISRNDTENDDGVDLDIAQTRGKA